MTTTVKADQVKAPAKATTLSGYERRRTGVAMLRATSATRDVWTSALDVAQQRTARRGYFRSDSDVDSMDELLYRVARVLVFRDKESLDRLNACLPEGVTVQVRKASK